MKYIIKESQLLNLFEERKLGSFELPNFTRVADFTQFLAQNRTKFIQAMGDNVREATAKVNSMESLFRMLETGEIKAGELINGVPVEQYITRQGGLRDDFIRFSNQPVPAKTASNVAASGRVFKKLIDLPPDQQAELLRRLELSDVFLDIKWKTFGKDPDTSSGWKFHVFGEDVYDSAELYEALKPLSKKWNFNGKVGVNVNMRGAQSGKGGATIYIPPAVIENNQVNELLQDIKSAIGGYKKGGKIDGDREITPAIHYRYELNKPIDPAKGISIDEYRSAYNPNSGGPYKPDNVPDLFETSPTNKPKPSITVRQLRSGDEFGTNNLDFENVDFSKITNAKNETELNRLISTALSTNNFNFISRGGFESYGIDNFREFLTTKIDPRYTSVNTQQGVWNVRVK